MKEIEMPPPPALSDYSAAIDAHVEAVAQARGLIAAAGQNPGKGRS